MVAVSPDQTLAYVANMQSGTVSILDLDQMKKITDLDAGTEPEGLAISLDGETLWIADRQQDELLVFDTKSLEKLTSLKTGNFPIRVAISPDGKTVVTSNLGDGNLSLFDQETRKSIGEISISGQRETGQVTLLFSEDGQRLYVAETGINKIAEIDMQKKQLVGRLSGGTNGDGLAIILNDNAANE